VVEKGLGAGRMFTGIVEDIGRVGAIAEDSERGRTLSITTRCCAQGMAVGDSIAVNGVCLTAIALKDGVGDERGSITVHMVPETLRRSNLADLVPGSPVNLERALTPTSRMGGHMVQGHVDGLGIVLDLEPEGDSRLIRIQAPQSILRYLVPKGFIAIDGASLTVVDLAADSFRIAFIPHTLAHSLAGDYQPGSAVNLEPDILGKYVERLIAARLEAVERTVAG